MKRIRDLVGRELKWTQPRALKRDFELKDGDEVVATLRFRSLFGTLATADTADGNWDLQASGLLVDSRDGLHRRTESEIATFRNNTWSAGGTLELADGRKFPANTNFWMSTYEFKDEAGGSIVRYHKIGGPLHLSSKVQVQPAAARLPGASGPGVLMNAFPTEVSMASDWTKSADVATVALGADATIFNGDSPRECTPPCEPL